MDIEFEIIVLILTVLNLLMFYINTNTVRII